MQQKVSGSARLVNWAVADEATDRAEHTAQRGAHAALPPCGRELRSPEQNGDHLHRRGTNCARFMEENLSLAIAHQSRSFMQQNILQFPRSLMDALDAPFCRSTARVKAPKARGTLRTKTAQPMPKPTSTAVGIGGIGARQSSAAPSAWASEHALPPGLQNYT